MFKPFLFLNAQKPSSLYLTGTRVDEWVDACGSGRSVATAVALGTAYNPTFDASLFGGKGGITFNNTYLESASPFPELNWKKGFTILMAGTFKNGFFAAADSAAILLGAGLGARLGMGTACNSWEGFPLVPCVFGFSWDGANGFFHLNECTYPITQGSLAPGSAAFGKLQIGGIIGAAGAMSFDLAGMKIWADDIEDPDHLAVEAQTLMTKYGIPRPQNPKFNIVVDGNSLAAGYWSSDKTTMWDGVKGISGTTPLDLINVATGGLETLSMSSRAVQTTDVNLNLGVPSKRRVLIAWEISNDLANLTQTDTAAYANIKAYCQARTAAGWRVIVGTCLPRTQPGINTNFETYRLSINTLINAHAVAEGWAVAVADFAADATIGVAGASDNTTYYNDKIHLTSAGHQIAAGIVTAALASIL